MHIVSRILYGSKQTPVHKSPGTFSVYKYCLTSAEITVIQIRWPHDRIISMVKNPDTAFFIKSSMGLLPDT